MSTRVPPHNLEAERSVLDAILICGALALEPIAVEERLRPDDFYREGHALIYRAMLALHGRREPIDTLTVSGQLGEDGGLEQAGGAAAVEELVGWVPAAGNARAYARIVREHAVRRRLLHVCYELQDRALDGQGEVDVLLADAGRRVGELLDQARASAARRMHELLLDRAAELQRLAADPEASLGLATRNPARRPGAQRHVSRRADHPGCSTVAGQGA